MKNEDKAFVDAYAAHVANAPEDVVKLFVSMDRANLLDHDEFYKVYPEYYSSLMDAWCLWHSALHFATKLKLESV